MTRVLLAATLLLFAGSAYAADMPLKAPPAAPPAPTWTGWYIGINGGGG
jgi:outer membrane immunogenic protein